MIALFWLLVVISVVVFVHEFGHYYVARLAGVKVEIFSIGFGKEIFSWCDKAGTIWKICWVPLGGYVKMFGDSEDVAIKKESDKEQAFSSKSLKQKAAIVFAGPLFNYLLAFILFTLHLFVSGKSYIAPIVSDIVADSPAYHGGIIAGDRVTYINNEKINNFQKIKEILLIEQDKSINLTVLRDGKEMYFTLIPKLREQKDNIGHINKIPYIGIIASNPKIIQLSLIDSLYESGALVIKMTKLVLIGIKQIITGERSTKDLGGPIKIAQYSAASASAGWVTLIWFIALISLQLGLFNLFPIPALDGSYLLLYFIEGVTGITIPKKVKIHLFRVGWFLLMFLMGFIIISDIEYLLQ